MATFRRWTSQQRLTTPAGSSTYAHGQKRLADLARSRGIDLIQDAGPALFVDPHTVRIPDSRTFGGDAVVIASAGTRVGSPSPARSSRSPLAGYVT